MPQVHSSADLGEDKVGGWSQLVSERFVPVDLSVGDQSRFNGTWIRTNLGRVGINQISASYEHAVRAARHVARNTSPSFVLVGVRSGSIVTEQFGRTCTLIEGSCALHFDGEPYTYAHDQPAKAICVNIPADHLSDWLFDPTLVCVTPKSNVVGLGKLILDFMRSAAGEAENLTLDGAHRVTIHLSQMLELLFQTGGLGKPVGGSAIQAALYRRARDIINSRLREHDLSPQNVADALGISVRYLHRVFQNAGSTVGEDLREQRLQLCHRRLADSRWDHVSLKQVGGDVGFRSQAQFSHAFSAKFGLSPGEFRALR